jgi:hypothetical protein
VVAAQRFGLHWYKGNTHTHTIDPKRSGVRYRTQFIGKNGRVLQESAGTRAVYAIKGDEGYVRARITDSNGKMAWT